MSIEDFINDIDSIDDIPAPPTDIITESSVVLEAADELIRGWTESGESELSDAQIMALARMLEGFEQMGQQMEARLLDMFMTNTKVRALVIAIVKAG